MTIRAYDIERAIKGYAGTGLYVIEQRYGLSCDLHRVVANTQTRVYGVEAGEEGYSKHSSFLGVVTNDTFSPSDDWSSGTLTEGFLYTTSNTPEVGDLVSVDREDVRHRKFKIIAVESLGTSDRVFKKLKLASLGD